MIARKQPALILRIIIDRTYARKTTHGGILKCLQDAVLSLFKLPFTSASSATSSPPMAAAVPRVMAPAAALVAPIVRVEAATLAARGTSPATVTTTAISAAQTPATLAGGQLDARPAPTDRPAVQPPDGILRVARVLELDEGEARRVAGHPNVPQRTVIREGILDFLLASVVSQLPDVNLGIMRVARHLLRLSV